MRTWHALALAALLSGAHSDCRVVAGANGLCAAFRLEPDRARLRVGETLRIRVRTPGCEGARDCACDPSGRRRRFRSADPAVATVDSTGTVAARAPGETTVTVEGEDPAAGIGTVRVTVRP